MAEQEKVHREKFDALMAERGVRPTALQPFWSVAGFALGAGSALLGPEAAMACTAAIEEEIDNHYSQQHDRLAEEGFRYRYCFDNAAVCAPTRSTSKCWWRYWSLQGAARR